MIPIRNRSGHPGNSLDDKIPRAQRPEPAKSQALKMDPQEPFGPNLAGYEPFQVDSLISGLGNGSSDHRTYFDAAGVQQWMTNTSLESPTFIEVPEIGQPDLASGDSGAFSFLQSSFSHVHLQNISQASGFQGPTLSQSCASGTGFGLTAMTAPGVSQGFDVSDIAAREQYDQEVWSYPSPVEEDVIYSSSTVMPCVEASDDPGFYSHWTSTPVQAGSPFFDGPVPIPSSGTTWSPVLAADLSVSSPYSQTPLLAFPPSTPISLGTQEESWCGAQHAPLDDGPQVGNTFGATGDVQLPSPLGFNEPRVDTSMLKPDHGLQSAPLPGRDSWCQEGTSSQITVVPQFPARRRASEGEPTSARSHPYYYLLPGMDGLYHCPVDGCNHRPEKLRCNYSKHLDSHLKPYRCKHVHCGDLEFSSTACLLRHEREAHGMHGHGDKPHLCHFSRCDRSRPGNGFPRRWNLGDHMKRVHAYTGAYSNGSSSPTFSSASSHGQGLPAKRRPSSDSQAGEAKRVKLNNRAKHSLKASPTVATPSSQKKRHENMWHEKKAAISAGLQSLDPSDVQASEQINADVEALQTIGRTIRLCEASQLVDQ